MGVLKLMLRARASQHPESLTLVPLPARRLPAAACPWNSQSVRRQGVLAEAHCLALKLVF